MIELAVEQDEAAMEAYLEGEEPSFETLKKCIRKGTIGNESLCLSCVVQPLKIKACSQCWML